MTEFETIIRGGTVLDGTGTPGRLLDVGIDSGRIAILDDLGSATAAETIDATGKFVAPGFIDIHTHSDLSHFIDPRAESQIRQGVTTEAIGQCGTSLAPCTAESRPAVFAAMGSKERGHWHTYAELLAEMDAARIATNVVGFVGHGALRAAVMGVDQPRPADDTEVVEMVRLLEESLEAGGAGLRP